MSDEIDRANVIRVWLAGNRWYAQIGPDSQGLIADGCSAAVAVSALGVMCGSLSWCFDPSWKPR